jgi:transposase-like protein
MQKADPQSAHNVNPNHVGADETVIRPNDKRDGLCAAVDSDTNGSVSVCFRRDHDR